MFILNGMEKYEDLSFVGEMAEKTGTDKISWKRKQHARGKKCSLAVYSCSQLSRRKNEIQMEFHQICRPINSLT